MLCVKACTFSWVTVLLPGGRLRDVFMLGTTKVIKTNLKRFDFLFAARGGGGGHIGDGAQWEDTLDTCWITCSLI